MQTCANASTVAFAGLEARRVEVQVQLKGGTHGIGIGIGIVIVGLGDKAVSEARERVRAAFASIGLAIPAGPADRQSRPRRHAERGDALRSADRAGDDGGDWRAAA